MGIIDVAKHCWCYAMEVVGNQSVGEKIVLRRPGRVFFPSSGNNHNFRNGITSRLKTIFLQRYIPPRPQTYFPRRVEFNKGDKSKTSPVYRLSDTCTIYVIPL